MWQHQEVAQALRKGTLIKPSNCSDCGRDEYEVFIEGHHPDYDKPLDVVWLCKECHLKEHRIIGSKAGAKKLPSEDKLSKTMVVYFTEEEKLAIKKYCKNKIPFSTLVRKFLIEKEIL